MTPDMLACQALLNCLVREVSGPEAQVREEGGYLIIALVRSARVLRAELRRPSAGIGPRLAGRVAVDRGGSWRAIGCEDLARMVGEELTLASGTRNEEFTAQVRAGRGAVAAIMAARRERPGEARQLWLDKYLASEQSLVAGHRFHPAPKLRDGTTRDWLQYAPEAGARFPLRFLGVRHDVVAEEGNVAVLDGLGGPRAAERTGLLPVHPWQFQMMSGKPWLCRAVQAGLVSDLGDGDRCVVPTSSVRTVYDPAADVFLKFSLGVRLTNCVRRSSWYELAGSVLLTGLLRPVFAELAGRYPATVLLGEPGYRTAALTARDAYEGLAVIVREGLAGRIPPGVTPLLAASLTEQAGGEVFAGKDSGWLLGWWREYLRLLVPPVLAAYFGHGIVLEPHLQNVLAGVDAAGWPACMVFRDLEGVKLVAARHERLLGTLAPGIAGGLSYDASRGWDRVAYCLFVNHLAELAAAIADHAGPDAIALERELWASLHDELTALASDLGSPLQLRAVLAGVPLPAKANLRVRWARAADREAAYIPVRNPMGPAR
jgi:siderophore synthetase component